MNDKINDFYYVYKHRFRKVIEEEYTRSDYKCNYEDIRTYNNRYSSFINVLLWLIRKYNYDKKLSEEINKFLESNNLMDRLKGLKLSREWIKLEMITSDN